MDLSIIIIFHNNRREAKRSLFALSKQYQRNIDDLEYEVLCIDSNSSEPINPEDFKSLEGQFVFHQFKTDNPSPADALQYGIDNAKSEHLCIMIDGAHIITPNVLNYFKTISSTDQQYFIYTHPFHLGEYYQNDNMMVFNYNQTKEDKLLNSTTWETDGYQLFDISNCAQTNENFGNTIFESNCFFINKTDLNGIGGINSSFKSKGGGYINLDIFKRAVESENIKTTALIGEGSFHQFHGGTSTNIDRSSELQKVFRKEFREVIGKAYSGPIYSPNFFGRINNKRTAFQNPNVSYIRIINDLNQIRKHEAASDILKILNKKYPFKEEYFIAHIKTLSNAGLYEEAEVLISDVLKINPNNFKVLDCIAKHYFLKKDFVKVEEINDQVLSVDDMNFNSLIIKFRLNSDKGKMEEARSVLEKLKQHTERIKANPIGDNLGLICLSKGFEEEAIYFHNISQNFRDSLDHLILGILIKEKRNEQFDNEKLERAIYKINTKSESLRKLINLTNILYRNELWELGLKLTKKIKAYYTDESISDFLIGKYLFHFKKYSECESHLRKFTQANQNRYLFPYAHYMLSKISLKNMDYNKFHKHAKESYKKIKNIKYGLNYVRSLQFLQNFKPALDELEKIIEYPNVNKEKIIGLIIKNAIKIGDLETIKKYNNDDDQINQNIDRLSISKNFKPVIFTHIQKCGGTSFRRYLSNAALYSGLKSNEIHIPGQNGQSPNTNLITLDSDNFNQTKSQPIKILADHSSFRSERVKQVIPNYEEAFNLTFFRHPIKRIYSSYYYFYFGKNFKNDEFIDTKLNDLHPKLLNKFIKQNSNVATAFISSGTWAPDHINVKPESLSEAKKNLDYFQFIGITEISSISMRIFNKVKPDYFQTFNKDLPLINKGSNVEADRFPNEKIKNKLIKANKLDIKLYNYGIAKFISLYKKFLTKEEIEKARSLKITDENLSKLYM